MSIELIGSPGYIWAASLLWSVVCPIGIHRNTETNMPGKVTQCAAGAVICASETLLCALNDVTSISPGPIC